MTPPPATIAQIQERFSPLPMPVAIQGHLAAYQSTILTPVSCSGVGVHSGADTTITLLPAAADTGVIFVRTDAPSIAEGTISALFSNVCDVTLSSRISNSFGYSVGTVEHLMAALSAFGIDNVIVEIDGPEVPIMDGSSKDFVELLVQASRFELSEARHFLRIVRPIRIDNDDGYCELVPGAGSHFEAVIDFESKAIGRQSYALSLDEDSFADNISDSRTFCMLNQVEAMHRAGLGLGGSMDNAIVVDDDKVLNEGGLRQHDEFVRHKLIDAVGDLYLAGLPIIGHYRGFKAGHALHNKLLHAMFMESDCFELVTVGQALQAAE